jgi:hypothetical protein
MPPEEARSLIRRLANEAFDWLSRRGERKFLEGDKGSLLYTLFLFLQYGRTPPEWACKEFVAAVRSNPNSWDAVFDRPKKRKQWGKGVKEAFIAGRKLHRELPINDKFFERLAVELKTSAATAKRRYYYLNSRQCSKRFSIMIGRPRRDLGREFQKLIPLIDAYMDAHPEAASQKSDKD